MADLNELDADALRRLRPILGAAGQARVDARLAALEGRGRVDAAPAPERFTCELPWSALASDNANVGVTGDREKRQRFKAAKLRAADLLREQYGERAKIGSQVAVTILVYVPDNRVRDCPNFLKATLDGLKAAVLEDDRWQVARRTTVDVAAIDPDRPRAVIVIEPYVEGKTVAHGGFS